MSDSYTICDWILISQRFNYLVIFVLDQFYLAVLVESTKEIK